MKENSRQGWEKMCHRGIDKKTNYIFSVLGYHILFHLVLIVLRGGLRGNLQTSSFNRDRELQIQLYYSQKYLKYQ